MTHRKGEIAHGDPKRESPRLRPIPQYAEAFAARFGWEAVADEQPTVTRIVQGEREGQLM
jgi:hypothetical protein